MANIIEQIIDNILHIQCGEDHIEVPLNYGSIVSLNGRPIPSGRIWELIGYFLSHNKRTPRESIVAEAKRSEIYCQVNTELIVWTQTPQPKDRNLAGNVFIRSEPQRIRYLLDAFDIKVAKADVPITPVILEEIFDVCESIKLYPCAAVDDRYYLSKDPEAVFEAFGTKDWQRIAVFLKRPSAACVDIRCK